MANMVNIQGINKEELLRALWEASSPASFYAMQRMNAPEFDLDLAYSQIHNNGYADYICGRVIKCNIMESDNVDPSMYDRDNGQGKFLSVVTTLRSL
jgi:hypothetical protein